MLRTPFILHVGLCECGCAVRWSVFQSLPPTCGYYLCKNFGLEDPFVRNLRWHEGRWVAVEVFGLKFYGLASHSLPPRGQFGASMPLPCLGKGRRPNIHQTSFPKGGLVLSLPVCLQGPQGSGSGGLTHQTSGNVLKHKPRGRSVVPAVTASFSLLVGCFSFLAVHFPLTAQGHSGKVS